MSEPVGFVVPVSVHMLVDFHMIPRKMFQRAGYRSRWRSTNENWLFEVDHVVKILSSLRRNSSPDAVASFGP